MSCKFFTWDFKNSSKRIWWNCKVEQMSESTKQGLKLKRLIKATAIDCSASALNSEVTVHYQQPPSEHLWTGPYAFFCSDHLSCQMEWTAWNAVEHNHVEGLSFLYLSFFQMSFWFWMRFSFGKEKFHLSYKSISTESKGSCGWQMLVRIKTYLLTSHAGIIAIFRI